MNLLMWKAVGRYSFDKKSIAKTVVRESKFRIPNNNAKRSFPAIIMVVTNQHNIAHSIAGVLQLDSKYEIYLENTEYSIKTSYGANFDSLEQAKFIADLKLIELGYEIENPFFGIIFSNTNQYI